MTTQLTSLTNFFRDLTPRNRYIVIAVASALVGFPVLRIAAEDYRGYIALGPGGPPHNIIGWLGQILLKPLKKEPLHTSCYDEKAIKAAGPNGGVAFLKEEDVPVREAPRPKIGSWTAPSRQLTDLASKDIIEVCSHSVKHSIVLLTFAGLSIIPLFPSIRVTHQAQNRIFHSRAPRPSSLRSIR